MGPFSEVNVNAFELTESQARWPARLNAHRDTAAGRGAFSRRKGATRLSVGAPRAVFGMPAKGSGVPRIPRRTAKPARKRRSRGNGGKLGDFTGHREISWLPELGAYIPTPVSMEYV